MMRDGPGFTLNRSTTDSSVFLLEMRTRAISSKEGKCVYKLHKVSDSET